MKVPNAWLKQATLEGTPSRKKKSVKGWLEPGNLEWSMSCGWVGGSSWHGLERKNYGRYLGLIREGRAN